MKPLSFYRARLQDFVLGIFGPPDFTACRTAVLLTFGQSNSANYGPASAIRSTHPRCYELMPDGSIRHAIEPLALADGIGASVWPRVARLLLKRDLYDAVVIASVGVGSTSVKHWLPEGPCFLRVVDAVTKLRMRGLTPTAICYHQGESDAFAYKLSTDSYADALERVVGSTRAICPHAPFFVSHATRFRNDVGPAIQEAQQRVIANVPGVQDGPDTDQLGIEYRTIDGVHLDDRGLTLHAAMWANVLEKWWDQNEDARSPNEG